jgi:hypothetical protein
MLPADSPTFRFARATRPEEVPAADPRVIDLALLDMNHGFPNLGHDSLVLSVAAVADSLAPALAAAGVAVRVVSYEVRQSGLLPEAPGGRFRIYLGTGGPGHIDPRSNDGVAPFAQGVREDPTWELGARALFAAILAEPSAVLLGVCHTFGLLCRWSAAATPALRGPEKGGKSRGVKQIELSASGLAHPWLGRFVGHLEGGSRLRVTDSRLFDLIPNQAMPTGVHALAREVGARGEVGDALTMAEWARDPAGVMPRVFAVNHHPEIHDLAVQRRLIAERIETGATTPEWREERREVLEALVDPELGGRMRLTTRITLLDPLRFHLLRQAREHGVGVHEDQILQA